jgi:glycosyltransferase involved in cell wall biosynthesis
MTRIVVWTHGFQGWGGGIDFLRMVISSLQHADPACEVHLAIPSRGPRLLLKGLARSAHHSLVRFVRGNVLPTEPPALDHVLDLARDSIRPIRVHQIDVGAAALAGLSRRIGADAIVPAFVPLPPAFPVPWVGYVTDFQHRHLPQLFSSAERARRDVHFRRMLTAARSVIVNARTVAADALAFHPTARARTFVLPFSAAPQPDWLVDKRAVDSVYGIDNPYFIVCNQFWKHKDHVTAFDAFSSIAARWEQVDLVCTGATHDYRDATYFGSLQRQLAASGLGSRVRILGAIPKRDQIALLRGAVALLQPTLFEGGPGGGAVFDAVALGVLCLVSSIPVNVEIDEPGVQYFAPRDAAGLASLMHNALAEERPARPATEHLLALGAERRARCGLKILDAVTWAGAT